MLAWTYSGEIFRQSRLAGRPIRVRHVADWSQDDRYLLATETVLAGLELFRTYGLVGRRWQEAGGASLTTYYVGACVQSFRPVYEQWFRDQSPSMAMGNGLLEEGPAYGDRADEGAVDPDQAAVIQDQVRRALAALSDQQLRNGLVRRALGYTQREAAASVGLSEKAMERRLSRSRHKLRTLGFDEQGRGQ
ncbi:RNA polymerase sigma factor [Streptomyces lutosisoli]|uniref:RNA polymerase sigma factor n=1 Tax=Streptomyces lutosisoli TaxID=2665721 RepID=A0ABW2W0E7_9ACTN